MRVENSGAYRLVLQLRSPARIRAGALGDWELAPGCYVYVGSARRNLAQRVARHRRLAESGEGRHHWHVDALLMHPEFRLERVEIHPGADEHALLRETLDNPAAQVPVPGFGASDCRSGCPAHLVYLPPGSRKPPA